MAPILSGIYMLIPAILVFCMIKGFDKLIGLKKELDWYGYGVFFGVFYLSQLIIPFSIDLLSREFVSNNLKLGIWFILLGPIIISSLIYIMYIKKRVKKNELLVLLVSILLGFVLIGIGASNSVSRF